MKQSLGRALNQCLRFRWRGAWLIRRPIEALFMALAAPLASAHIVPPEKLHPVAENYRRVSFILNVVPVAWDQVDPEIVALAEYWRTIDPEAAENFLKEGRAVMGKATIKPEPEKGL